MPTLPAAFVAQMQALLGDAYPAFEAALRQPVPVSIRLNPARPLPQGHPYASLPGVPWHPEGRYLPQRPVFTLDPLFHAGAYYVQEASSMFLHEALRQHADFDKPLKILDLCAAPGGKSTLLAAMLGSGGGILVANETIRTRVSALRENLEQWGAPNVAVCSAEAEELAALEGWFDVVVADAPCSGEGLFRKDPDAVREWSPEAVAHCAARQRRILAAALEALAPGGLLVYSTCTYNARENDDNAAWLQADFGLRPLPLELPEAWGVQATRFGHAFFPHCVQGEGFYLAIFQKDPGASARKHQIPPAFRQIKPPPKELLPELRRWFRPDAALRFFQTPGGELLALPEALEKDYLLLDKHLKIKWFGTALGTVKGRDLVPAHGLALSQWANPDLPTVALSLQEALVFLKKEAVERRDDMPNGWALAQYEGLSLGWLKVLPNRTNNYLPQERRIRMAV
jgi:16S rRNA C967 or C1407 C5-methylase (RsmB/RsmF family)/NOL1/NOP2/fmu family ribosome biogenesis protein